MWTRILKFRWQKLLAIPAGVIAIGAFSYISLQTPHAGLWNSARCADVVKVEKNDSVNYRSQADKLLAQLIDNFDDTSLYVLVTQETDLDDLKAIVADDAKKIVDWKNVKKSLQEGAEPELVGLLKEISDGLTKGNVVARNTLGHIVIIDLSDPFERRKLKRFSSRPDKVPKSDWDAQISSIAEGDVLIYTYIPPEEALTNLIKHHKEIISPPNLSTISDRFYELSYLFPSSTARYMVVSDTELAYQLGLSYQSRIA